MLGPETWIVLVAGAVSAAIAVMIARLVRNREFEPEDVTIGFLGPSLAALYLLVLALSLATEWQTIGSAQQAVSNEAVAARQLYWSADGLPAGAAAALRIQVRGYVTAVLGHDWPQMERGTLDGQTEQMLARITGDVLKVNPASSGAATAQSYALGQINALTAAREQREAAAETHLPDGLIAAVIATSLVVCVFPFAGGIRPAAACIAMAALQAALVTVGIVVVFQLNHAFAGPLAADPGPLAAVAHQISAP
ncbi:MAG TPA: hypothetical protein VKV33_11995 [Streptosporangiaceae bacterium]|nr:hypothetical protein [Streptosporangiaceae bacterium]